MSRSPRHDSDRIGRFVCQWRRHVGFADDLGKLDIDAATWSAIKVQMRRAASGTVRGTDWEYPCTTARGQIGELRHAERSEVTVEKGGAQTQVSVTINYRVYFNEPTLAPEELWAIGAGAKSLSPHYEGTDQQNDIQTAVNRVNALSRTGSELITFDP